jgi:hypothetical protein
MPQLPVPQPNSVHGASPSSYADADGVVFFSTFTNGGQRVYKLVGGQPQEVVLEHLPTARGRLSVEPTGLWLTAWDDGHTALWRMAVPGWKPWPAPPGPAGRTILNGIVGDFYLNTAETRLYGPKTTAGWGSGISLIGPSSGGATLSARYVQAMERLCAWFGI